MHFRIVCINIVHKYNIQIQTVNILIVSFNKNIFLSILSIHV